METHNELQDLEKEKNKIYSQKKSSEVRLGQIAEQMAPFLDVFPYNPKRAHFLGMPIDYIVFEDNVIIFVEVKSGKAVLNNTQANIKKLVEGGRVAWKEIRVDGEMQTTSGISGNEKTDG